MSKKNQNPWAELLGHRVIVEPTPGQGRDDFFEREYLVLEISPSGERVRFRNGRGGVFWSVRDEYSVVEDLGLPQAQQEAK